MHTMHPTETAGAKSVARITRDTKWQRVHEGAYHSEGSLPYDVYQLFDADGLRIATLDVDYTSRDDLIRWAGEAAVLAFEAEQAAVQAQIDAAAAATEDALLSAVRKAVA